MALFIVTSIVKGQTWSETVSPGIDFDNTGYSGLEEIKASCTDASGNVYITGTFDKIIKFGATTLTAYAYEDIFVAKMNANGTWAWAVSVEGDKYERTSGIGIDNSGNILISGIYRGETRFGSFTLDEESADDIFVAKLSSTGQWLWANHGGSKYKDDCAGLVIDHNGNSYISGYLGGKGMFSALQTSPIGSKDLFLAKIDYNGSWNWAKSYGSSSSEKVFDMCMPTSTTIAVTGEFNSTMTLGASVLTNNGNTDGFIAEFNLSGVPAWGVSFGGANSDVAKGICYDNGQYFVTGYFNSSIVIGGVTYNSAAYYDAICLSYTRANGFDWAFTVGGSENDGGSYCFINDGAVYFAGNYDGEITFNNTILNNKGSNDNYIIKTNKADGSNLAISYGGSAGSDDIVTTAVKPNGDMIHFGHAKGLYWFDNVRADATGSGDIVYTKQRANGTVTDNDILESFCLNNKAYATVVDASGNRYIAGSFYGTIRFGNKLIIPKGGSDGFIAKYNANGSWDWATSLGASGDDVVYDMDFDSNGDLIICGSCSENSIFGIMSNDSLRGYNDAFVSKVDVSNGSFEWVKIAGTEIADDRAVALVIDDNDNIFVAGSFLGDDGEPCYFDDSFYNNTKGFEDLFVAKLDNNGHWQWAENAGGNYDDYATDIAIDNSGNLFVAGRVEGGYTFGTIAGNTKGYDDSFAARMSPSGTWEKVVVAGSDYYGEEATAIDVDENGQVYLGGHFTRHAYFSDPLTTKKFYTKADKRGYLATLNSNLEWQTIELLGDDRAGVVTKITDLKVDQDGDDLYVAVSTNSDITINSKRYHNIGKIDAFYIKKAYDLSNQYISHIGGYGNDIIYNIFPKDEGEVYIAAQYSHNTVLGSNTYPLRNTFDNQAIVAMNEYIPDPPPWTVPVLTENTSVVNIPKSILPLVNGHSIRKGDAIGVFYYYNGTLHCAGFGVYMKNDISIVVRGDNLATTEIDGFPSEGLYIFKTWDGMQQKEYFSDFNIADGPRRYKKDAITNIKYFPMQTVYSQEFALKAGWNVISTNIAPRNANTQAMLDTGDPNDKVLLIRNINGEICFPNLNLNSIGYFDERYGYSIYANEDCTFTIYGDTLDFNIDEIPLQQGWNIMPYWVETSETVSDITATISTDFLLIKNGKNQIYFPDLNLFQFTSMHKGEGYYIYMRNPRILKFKKTY